MLLNINHNYLIRLIVEITYLLILRFSILIKIGLDSVFFYSFNFSKVIWRSMFFSGKAFNICFIIASRLTCTCRIRIYRDKYRLMKTGRILPVRLQRDFTRFRLIA